MVIEVCAAKEIRGAGIVVLVWSLALANVGFAQEKVASGPAEGEVDLKLALEVPEFEPSYTLRLSHLEGRQLGDTLPVTLLGITRFSKLEEGISMLDAEARVTKEGEAGGSVGGVYRHLLDENSIVSAGLWFDIHKSQYDRTFHQVGASVEWFRELWTFRGNGYFPTSDTRQTARGPRGRIDRIALSRQQHRLWQRSVSYG